MINLTEAATKKVMELRAQEGLLEWGLRLRVVGGGCSGFQYGMDFEKEEQEGDRVFSASGVRVFVDATSLEHLDGTTLDYVEETCGSGFKFNNPNVKASCGCGTSFSA